MIKCVVWDIDNTLLTGTYLESGQQLPTPDAELLAVARELDRRGIVHALASKNPPAAADYVTTVTGLPFAAAECGWGRKSDAVTRIIGELSIGADAVAFVDDDLMERAEVAAALPDVLVLSPEDAAEAVTWPEFSPAVLTDEGRRRGELYAQRRRRQDEAKAFGGTRDEFLQLSGSRVVIGRAELNDLGRLHELSVRTHQFNSVGEPVSQEALAAAEAGPGGLLIAVRLSDRFGDDGIVGGALVQHGEADGSTGTTAAASAPAADSTVAEATVAGGAAAAWTVPLLMMSCRALGRGVLDAVLAWLCQAAAAAGAEQLRIPCLITDRNVPLRLAFKAAGFRAEAGTPAIFVRDLSGSLPALPDWAKVEVAS